MLAAAHGSQESVEALVAAGADIRRREKSGRNAAEFARSAGFVNIAQYLDERAAKKSLF